MGRALNIEQIQERILALVEDVPFGNSNAQNRIAIVDGEQTPCRALRHSALRIINRLEAMRECEYAMRRRDIEIKMLERELASATDPLKRELITLDIEQKRGGGAYTRKLFKDAMREIESLWPVLQAMGKVTRDQFEAEEIEHYAAKHKQELDFSNDLFARIGKGAALPPLAELLAITGGDTNNEIGE